MPIRDHHVIDVKKVPLFSAACHTIIGCKLKVVHGLQHHDNVHPKDGYHEDCIKNG
jgi:hypothetical protein